MNRACLFVVLALCALLALAGCDNDTTNVVDGPGGNLPVTDKTCIGCHASQAELQLALGDTKDSEVLTWNKDDG